MGPWTFWILPLVAAVVSAYPGTEAPPVSRNVCFLGDDGQNYTIDGSQQGEERCDAIPIDRNRDLRQAVTFHLYTRRGPSKLYVGDIASLRNSKFNASLPTRMITHGLGSSEQANTIQYIEYNYYDVEDSNLIGVDWSKLAHTSYCTARKYTEMVGPYIAQLIDFLVENANLNLAKVHLIGHSLGAHVMGLAGKNLRSGKVARITGLDPAGVFYKTRTVTNRLAVGDARFVDIIHTCGGMLGFKDPIGDVDFYPNNGMSPQPGCTLERCLTCSHSRAWEYYAESITHDAFKAVPCENYERFKAGRCDHLPKASMGHSCTSEKRGIYYLKTASLPPYGLSSPDRTRTRV